MNRLRHTLSAWHIPPRGGAWGGRGLCCALLLLLLLSPGCHRTRPQLPSNKPLPTEVPALDVARMNREMAQREDSLITAFVASHYPDMEKTGDGYWMRVERVAGGRRIAWRDTCRVRCRLAALDGRVLEEMPPRTVVVGKQDIVPGLDAALQRLCPGEQATCIFPSHLAYGMKGHGHAVPPYTPVMLRVEVDALSK